MTSLLTNYSFLSPLKRQRVVRNRSNNNPTTPSKRANRLPVLPELSGEQDESSSSPSSISSSSSVTSSPSSTSSHSTSPKAKRLSRYGKEEFGAFALTDDFLSAPPRVAPQPPSASPPSSSSSTKSKRRSVCLSEFDIIIDISASEPASPVTETPAPPSTPPRSRDYERRPPPRSRSPTPSLTSMSACSSIEMPTTPGADDDEWPGLRPPSDKADVARPRISKHPLMVIKSTSSVLASDENSEDTFEFTLVPFSPLPRPEAEGKEDQEEEGEDDDVLWYSRELSQVISLSSPRAPTSSPTRPDSLLPLPRDASSGTDRPSAHSRMSKPLPAVPPTTLPNLQLDPTFPQYLTVPPRMALRASAHPSTPPSPLVLPPPVAPASQGRSTSAAPPSSSRKSLTITVPHALPCTSLPKEVSDILDDVNAWSIGTPSASTSSSTRTSTLILSPPRLPHSPAMSMYSEYDPLEFIVSYAARPPSPALSTPAAACTAMAATFLDLEDEDEEAEAEGVADNCKIHSRWSCSTIATLAPPASPTSSASARLRFHLGEVARRVRARRAGGSKNSSSSNNNGSGEGTGTVSIHRSGALHIRSSSESALSGSVSSSSSACSDLRRRPIPLELFSR